MTDRLTEGLKFVTEQLSCSRDEFHRAHLPQGAMLLEGLQSQGYVRTSGDRVAVSQAGLRRLQELAPAEECEPE